MECQHVDCSNESAWVQLTIFGEEHYCDECLSTLGGTFKDTLIPEYREREKKPVPLSGK